MTGDSSQSRKSSRLRSPKGSPSLFWTGILVGCVLALAVMATSAFALSPGVSASDESTVPGESVTVELSVADAQTLELSRVPSSWTVESRENAGAFASGGDSYAGWVWNDDRASETVSVTFHVPADADEGAYVLAVTAEKSDGSRGETSTTVTVDGTAPTADAGSDRTTTVDGAVSFDGTASSDDVGVTSYKWEFGDGTTATGPTPEHAFADQGTYTVTLTVADAAGNHDMDTLTVTVDSQQTTTTTTTETTTARTTTETTTAATTTATTATTTERSSGGDDGGDDGDGDDGVVDDGDGGSGGSSTTSTTATTAMTRSTSVTETVKTTPSTTATTGSTGDGSSTGGSLTSGTTSTAGTTTVSTGTTSAAPVSGTSATGDGGQDDSGGSNGFTALAGLVAVTAAALLARRRNP